MIKIEIDDNIKELIQTEHFKDNKRRIKSIIEDINGISKYKKLHDYFSDESGSIDEKN
ncbi:hypothetical protein [Alkalihalobacillus alcalophilus]|uniref:hypothetical protein n=1 Tax=Alkalihalobacillus alcalophilus TaxID=1445 RepID=UPI001F3F1CDA|nr:hypothetical protein [Alkalihalobacillus alcalophilus]